MWGPAGTYKKHGGRLSNEKQGLESRGVAGGWKSNRLYAGMERRRKDWSAHEGVEICQKALDMQAGGADAAEVNRCLRKHCAASEALNKKKKLRSVKNVLQKGQKYWKGKLEKVQVVLDGRSRALRRVCDSSAIIGDNSLATGRGYAHAGP